MKFCNLLCVVALSGVFTMGSAQQSEAPVVETKPTPAKPEGVPKPPKPKAGPGPQNSAAKANQPKAKPKAKPKAEEPKKYVIQSGDNPWTIARDHGVDHDELLKINKIEDPTNLKIGDVLILPKGVASKNAPKKESASKPDPGPQTGDGWEMYTIRKGDNPWTISKALKVDHQKILTLNEGMNFTDLKIGQQIKVPKKP